MTDEQPRAEERFEPVWSPITAAVALLGIYVAMYLAVAGIVRLAAPPEAFAQAPAQTSMAAPADGASTTTEAARPDPAQEHADAHSD